MTMARREEDVPLSIRPVGGAIRQRREELGLSRVELAQRLGPTTHPRDIERIESGQILFPRWSRLLGIAAALGCSPAELVTPAQADGLHA